MSDAALGFALIAIIVLLGSFFLRRAMGRRAQGAKSVKSASQRIEWCQDEISVLLGLLEQQSDTARAGALAADSQGEENHARFFALIPEGNERQRTRLFETFGCDEVSHAFASADLEKIESAEWAMERLLDQNAEMHQCCTTLKTRLRKARKIKAFQKMREFDDFLKTREKVIVDLQRGSIKDGQTMELCGICGSIFANDPPAFCLGCSAMNVEFISFGPQDGISA